MRIDAHQHFWRLARGDYGWLTPELGAIHRDFEPDDLHPLMKSARIDATVLVQAAPTAAETEFLLHLAERHDWILGVVGWADLAASDAAATVERLARHSKLVGLRPMIQDIADDDWMLGDELRPALEAMTESGLRFDALVLPRHLERLADFRDRYPALSIVIDHCAKPPVADGATEPWATDIARLARDTDVLCKLSGLATEAGEGWNEAKLAPYAAHVLDEFGPTRVMWGSDWPVLELAGDYAAWAAMAERAVAPLGEAAVRDVFGDTARRFYTGEAT